MSYGGDKLKRTIGFANCKRGVWGHRRPCQNFMTRIETIRAVRGPNSYEKMYARSISDPEGFWGEMAAPFFWFKKWDKVLSYDWDDKFEVKWFEGGKTNICVNALDRHLPQRKNQTALLWVGNEPGQERRVTYGQLFEEVCRLANVLKSFGVKKGDRISIYMPMIPE